MTTRSARFDRRWLVIIAINLAAALVLLFAATEWFIARKRKVTIIYEPNPIFRHSLYPNQRYERDGVYTIGPHRMRGRAPVMPKPKEHHRVFVMGGSSVFDFLVAPSWPERIQTELAERGHRSIEVFNAGVPGFSTREVLGFYAEQVRPLAPDTVLLYAGWNDVKYMRAFRNGVVLPPYPEAKDPRAMRAYRWLLAPRPLRNVYALPLMVEKLRLRAGGSIEENPAPPSKPKSRSAAGAAPPLSPPPPPPKAAEAWPPSREAWAQSPGMTYFRKNVTAFVRAVREDGARPILVTECTLATRDLSKPLTQRIAYGYVQVDHDTLVTLNEVMIDQLKAVSASTGADLLEVCEGINGRAEFFKDHVHLVKAGSRAVARAVAAALADRLPAPRLD